MNSSGTDTQGEAIQVKKYGNRRLYSSSDTRFITVDEITNAVRRGRRVVVTDADSKQDITAEILTQILLETRKAQHFPVEMLEQMIRLNEEALKSFWGSYLNQSLRVLQNFQKSFFSLLGKGDALAADAEAAPAAAEPMAPRAVRRKPTKKPPRRVRTGR